MATGEDKPLGPPKAACENVAEILKTRAEIKSKWESIKAAVRLVVKTITMIRMGLIDIGDVLGAEIIAAVGAAAAEIASAITSAAAGYMNAMLEALFSSLLKILLAFPNAIFSLVAIPLENAIESGNRERYFILEAKRNLNRIMKIINKWVGGMDDTKYYRQIVDALPYIRKSLALTEQMLAELDGKTETGAANVSFDEGKYKVLRSNIDQAIEITKPASKVEQRLGLIKLSKSRRDAERKRRLKELDNKYKPIKREHDEWREDEMLKARANMTLEDTSNPNFAGFTYNSETGLAPAPVTNLDEALEMERIDLEYAARITLMDTQKAEAKRNIELDIADEHYLEESDALRALAGVAADFENDMNLLGKYLVDFLDNVKDGFLAYKTCQVTTNTVYNIRSLIGKIIEFLISMLRRIGNAGDVTARLALEGCQLSLEVVSDDFEEVVEDFEILKENALGASSMSLKVAIGHVLLQSGCRDTLKAGITESLIQLLNADDVLEEGKEEFDEFLGRVAAIQDWDGKQNVWAVNPLKAASSPYIQLIADASSMIAQVPILSLSARDSDKRKIKDLSRQVNSQFRLLTNHNSLVMQVLNSYTPYQSGETGNLKRVLANAGLLGSFAELMSIVSLIKELEEINLPDDLSDLIPTATNCKKYYPELFSDPKLIAASIRDRQNQVDPRDGDSGTQNAESKQSDNDQTNAEIETAALAAGKTDDDMKVYD